ncbi:hypothetical protein QQ045_029435 [Rhodiola kirilowii]
MVAGNIEGDVADAVGPSTGKIFKPSAPDLQPHQPTNHPLCLPCLFQLRSHITLSPTISRPSVDHPLPISQPYPGVDPAVEHVRGNSSVLANNGVTKEQNRVYIKPVGGKYFRPAKHGIDIGLHCISKHWVAGWTTIERCEQWAKDLWFEEFQAKARWHEDHTPAIKAIFFKKCRKKLNDVWYNLRHARTAEGIMFLKRHEVQAGLMWYYRNAVYINKISDRNKINSQGKDGRCIHMGDAKAAHIDFEELGSVTLPFYRCMAYSIVLKFTKKFFYPLITGNECKRIV